MSLHSEFPDRLVQLADGRPGLRGALVVDVREPGAGEAIPSPGGEGQGEGGTSGTSSPATRHSPPILDFISSDETLDRYDEIITASGWQLATYQRNPIFQNAHQYGDIIFTLGKALITEVRLAAPPSTLNSQPSPHLFQRIQFATDVNPMARIAYGLYKGKFLNAVSVGFIPVRWEDGPGPEKLSTLNSQLSTQQFRRRYLEQELLEVSAVGIPANPNALALAYKSGAVEKSDLQETADLLRALCAVSPTHGTHGTHVAHGTHGTAAPLQPSTCNLQPLLALARDLRNLLLH